MAQHGISAAVQVRALAKAVSAAFSASPLTNEDKFPGVIERADLAWQAPPLLLPGMEIGGAMLQDFVDTPLPLDPRMLHGFWKSTLEQMWNSPSRILARGALANCGWAMPKVRAGQRRLRFALPAGYPSQLDDSAGLMLSLEVAHAARISLPVKEFISDSANYYVVGYDDRIYGVKDGRPAVDSSWEYNASGYVPMLLEVPRGEISTACEYDQLASLRSVLHVHAEYFPNNFEALDWALQALRLLAHGQYLPELAAKPFVPPPSKSQAMAIERALRDAITMCPDLSISDRDKLRIMEASLVPGVCSMMAFRKNIFSSPQYPFTLAPGKLEKIEAWLRQEYQSRVPAEHQQLREI